jgi:hypothetical protein
VREKKREGLREVSDERGKRGSKKGRERDGEPDIDRASHGER